MLLHNALEILELNIREAGKKMPPDTLRALIMLTSAGHRIQTMRSYNINQAILPLKGETSRNGQHNPLLPLKNVRESPLGGPPQA